MRSARHGGGVPVSTLALFVGYGVLLVMAVVTVVGLLVLAAAVLDDVTGRPATRRRMLLESRTEHAARLRVVEPCAPVVSLEAWRTGSPRGGTAA